MQSIPLSNFKRFNSNGDHYYYFESMSSMIDFVESNIGNALYVRMRKQSEDTAFEGDRFYGTENIHQAIEYARYGWESGVEKLNKDISIKNHDLAYETSYNVVGGRCSVPRFLSGIPTNMIHRKAVERPDKIITLVKFASFNVGYSAEAIQRENVKFIQIIQNLESKGYRCNVEVIFGTSGSSADYRVDNLVRVKIKRADERLNVSKICFPLSHPSMSRRFIFKVMEVDPELRNTGADNGTYGYPIFNYENVGKKLIKPYLKENEYFVPLHIDDVESFSLEKLQL